MLISELTFPHLLAEHEARLTRELERRRVVRERLDDDSAHRLSRRQSRRVDAVESERMPRAGRETTGARATDPCTA
jgi:hypothetical protein